MHPHPEDVTDDPGCQAEQEGGDPHPESHAQAPRIEPGALDGMPFQRW